MASPYQQQALRRKLIYVGLIVALFTVSGIFRVYVVEARAEELSLREQNLGEVEISSAALELSLTGSRGFVVSALWYWAMDAQKKNRWNELDLYCDSLTRLQPHFIRPWLFQSWNLSYNVAVEADQVKDKYFYVSRGVQLLSRGERKNHYNPDMRFNMGFYQQHKIMQSDETNVFRCLYQMSCMPYPERDPERFWTEVNGRRVIDLAVFEDFCTKHPQFVRRLHDKLRCGQPEDVVAFLNDNKQIPSLFIDDPDVAHAEWAQGHTPLKPVPERFPALPPPADVRKDELPATPEAHLYDPAELSYESELKDDFDAYAGARAWFAYAQDPLPAPDPVWPGVSSEIVDRTRQRKPQMTTSLFRNHPPRAQSYVAERLQDEGWFGPEGWLITGWFPRDRFRDGREARVGTEALWGTKAHWGEVSWKNAYEWWKRRGLESHIISDSPQQEAERREKALVYVKARGLESGASPGPEPAKDSPDHAGWEAARYVFELGYTRGLTNVMNFYYRAAVEMEPEGPEGNGQALIEARRTMFNARQSVRLGRRDRAAELFESKTGLERLRLVLESHPDFLSDSNNQEAFYELELRYVKLKQDKDGGTYKQWTAAGLLLGAGLPPGPPPAWPGLLDLALTDPTLTSALPVPEFVPPERMRLEAPGKDGKPFINDQIIYQVKVRHGLVKPAPPPPQAMRPGMRPDMIPGAGAEPPK